MALQFVNVDRRTRQGKTGNYSKALIFDHLEKGQGARIIKSLKESGYVHKFDWDVYRVQQSYSYTKYLAVSDEAVTFLTLRWQ